MKEERGFYRLEGRETEMGRDGRKELRTELLEQLKEEEKVQRQEEYEQRLAQAVNEVSMLAAGKGGAASRIWLFRRATITPSLSWKSA